MKQHKPQESTPEQNSSDEDMEESPKNLNSLGIIKNISEEWWQTEAWKREEYSHTLTPTLSHFNKCLAQLSQIWLVPETHTLTHSHSYTAWITFVFRLCEQSRIRTYPNMIFVLIHMFLAGYQKMAAIGMAQFQRLLKNRQNTSSNSAVPPMHILNIS
ncbi:UNVERIFIED_CONTAM: hypothetical protein NCL1_32789 [Trichonephila clavipes]